MLHTRTIHTPTTADRLSALVAIVRREERASGCPADQLATAERYALTQAHDTFRNEEAPDRVFFVRVLTLAEAKRDAGVGLDILNLEDPVRVNGRQWLVLDALEPVLDPLNPTDEDRRQAAASFLRLPATDIKLDGEGVFTAGDVATPEGDRWVKTLAETLDAGLWYDDADLWFDDNTGTTWVISTI
jgi:hypothetical protein